MVTYKVTLTRDERESLMAITRKGSHTAKKVIHSLILLNVDQGEHSENKQTNEDICRILKTGMRTIDRLKKQFVLEGVEATLGVAPTNRIYQRKIDCDAEAHLIAIACGKPPKGYAKWSLRLLADRMVELRYIDDISHETVRKVLKKTNLSLGE